MAIRTIRQAGDEILKKKSRPIEEIDERIKELAEDMIETMHKYDGVGLAGVQVGVLKQIVVIDVYEEDKPVYVLINPKILEKKGTQIVDEGCLSFPTKFGKVERPEEVTVQGLNLKGKKIKIKGTGLLAQAICHELDHLNGELFVEKVIPGTLEEIKGEK